MDIWNEGADTKTDFHEFIAISKSLVKQNAYRPNDARFIE